MEKNYIPEKQFYYKIIKKVGSGAFGSVFKAESKKDPGKIVALKCEETDPDKKDKLKLEYNFYRDLNINQNHIGIPKVFWYGVAEIREPVSKENTVEIVSIKNVMAMEYLGPSLEKLFIYLHKNFSLKTIL